MLPDPIHLQTSAHQDVLRREAAANRLGRPHADEPRGHVVRLPQLLRRIAGLARPLAA